jgi:hypothetical protein
MSSGASNVSLPPQQTLNIAPIASDLSSTIGSLGQYNIGTQFTPNVQQLAQQYLSNPYANMGQGGANLFGGLGVGQALGGIQNANTLGATVDPSVGAAYNLMALGNDPQSALYNRTKDQLTQQTLANLSNAGIATTPYGQSTLGNVMSNFNIDWQNNLLNRALAGDQGAMAMLQGAGGMASGAMNLGMGGVGAGIQSAFAPSTAYQQILGGMLQGPSFATSYGQNLAQIPQIQAGDYLGYLNAADQANQVANQQAALALQQQQQGWNQMMDVGKGIGQAVGWGMTPSGPFGMGPSPFSSISSGFGSLFR